MVIEHRDVWFMDDGALSRELCEEKPHKTHEEENGMPEVIEDCCACDEAKYEVSVGKAVVFTRASRHMKFRV